LANLFVINKAKIEKPPEVTFVFPENKPKQVVENMNENDEVPADADLLSERNSKASNRQILDDQSESPFSEGNTDIANLSQPANEMEKSNDNRYFKSAHAFDRNALLDNNGGQASALQKKNPQSNFDFSERSKNDGTNNQLDQGKASSDMLGDISLSTYAWDWAYYINSVLKPKLYQVWRSPPAYNVLGLIHGNTLMEVVVDRKGNLKSNKVLKHNGHNSLQLSSENAINNVFPLEPLPPDFPEDSLIIKINLIYPELSRRSR
jgi:hypothetical protein